MDYTYGRPERGLAYRRAQKHRMRAKAARIIKYVWGNPRLPAWRYANNLCICSCEMCQPGAAGKQVLRAGEASRWELREIETTINTGEVTLQ
jgi:hypothetical protein